MAKSKQAAVRARSDSNRRSVTKETEAQFRGEREGKWRFGSRLGRGVPLVSSFTWFARSLTVIDVRLRLRAVRHTTNCETYKNQCCYRTV